MRRSLPALALLLAAPMLLAASTGEWLTHVPVAARRHTNPYSDDADAVAAGAILYQRSCASCHGTTAQGSGSHPSLRSRHVQQASDGELHWLLTNGDLRHGMPSWSRLPDAQRWQIVRYLHSLPLEEESR